MSIPVDVDQLERAAAEHGTGSAYLLSTGGDGRVKVVTVDPVFDGGSVLVRGPGGGTVRNVGANQAVTLVFPPRERHGYTLLSDGTAALVGDSAEDVRVAPASGVLHRPADHADGPVAAGADGCGHDCAPVTSSMPSS